MNKFLDSVTLLRYPYIRIENYVRKQRYSCMVTVSITTAKKRLNVLARLVEKGEKVVITRNGKPILDLVPHRVKSGVDLNAGQAYLRQRGVTQAAPSIADDFDAPLAEDFLLKPLR